MRSEIAQLILDLDKEMPSMYFSELFNAMGFSSIEELFPDA
jgi:hypothetical protein